MLRKRVITALWGIPLLIVAAWFDEPLSWFTILATVWGLLALVEFYRLVGVLKNLPLAVFGLLFTLLFILYPHFTCNLAVPPVSLLLTAAVALSLVMLVFLPKEKGLFNSWAWMLGGILYIGWLVSYLVALRLDAGRGWLFMALFTTFGSDTAAYFIGKAFGRHKLAPAISPGKTREGAIAGLFGAIIVSLVVVAVFKLPINYTNTAILGVLISIFGQLGDLVESLLKRNAGVKDAGNLMPGHGGVLDRLDSIIFAGVVVYLYYIFVVL